ncbi:hypothetical protein PR003_g19710 [Phytophthora rubi]|uniref:Uncharacterized protein n=1 Tax=Phytophthora rubi TaxID=129364 RepID=A0A6A4DX51_9STRA|nr:hypothetical protein PR002_g19071 [Phytophthora rubi]KAE9312656.1 hypothetical protein PR003_g19710 [Phytophthora rubi]
MWRITLPAVSLTASLAIVLAAFSSFISSIHNITSSTSSSFLVRDSVMKFQHQPRRSLRHENISAV